MKSPLILTAAVGLFLFVASGATAQSHLTTTRAATEKQWALPRTPWGDPDLQAVWSTEDLRDIPYERPDEQAGRLQLTDAEFAARVARAKREEGRNQTGFANASKTRTFRQTSLIVDGDGKYPHLTAEALRRFRITDIGSYGEGPFLGPEDLNLYDRCITRGVVGSLLPVAYGNGLEIFQTPAAVVINYEMVHETRVIPLDGRAHVGPRIRMYMGDSRGHWDGDTLVVESTNFTNKTSVGRNGYGPHNSQALRLVERFTRVSQEQIGYEVYVNDPETWVRPFKMAFPLTTQAGYQIFPYECHEGNLMIVQALSGARAEDRAAAEAWAKGIPVPPRLPMWEAPGGSSGPSVDTAATTQLLEVTVSSPYESADLLMKLYDLRREATMREARTWFFMEFNPSSVDDLVGAVMGSHSGHFRMVTSYWDMAASFVANGAIDEKMFNDANGEQVGVFAKVEPFLAEYRTKMNIPNYLTNLKQVVLRRPGAQAMLAAYRERLRGVASASR